IFDVFIPSRAPLHAIGMVEFAREVENLSDGTLKITIPSAPMAPPPRLFDMVEDGIADIALAPVIYAGKRIQLPSITDVFSLADTAPAASVALWRTYEKYFEAADEWGGVVPITLFTHGDEHLFVKGKGVDSITSVDGIKVVSPSPLHADRIKSLGGVPVGGPAIQMFELINGGVAEAIFVPFGPAMVQGLVGVTDNITTIPGGISRPAFSVIMNRDVFESLTPKQQDAIMQAGGENLAAKLGAIVEAESAAGIEAFTKAGATFTPASTDMVTGLDDRLGFIEENWLKIAEDRGIDGPAALAFYRETVAEMEGN
ncbi:MAG: hypothetical protein AAGF79_14430, partial [Pseudomonadota bacterium]